MKQVLFVDKPAGVTSFDVIRALRRKLGVARIGHAGTLDPAATGLLIIGVGSGRKKLKNFLHLPKTYIANILFGRKTSTGDLEGEIIEEREVDEIDLKDLQDVLASMVGEVKLKVPVFSAVKVAGKPLYKYARGGVNVKTPTRTRRIYSVKLLGVEKIKEDNKDFMVVKIEIEVEAGTYIRSVAEEIGQRLRIPATLAGLRRTKIGDFNVTHAKKLDQF